MKKPFRFLLNTYLNFCKSDMFVYAANATFWLVIAAFPMLILLLSVLRFFPSLQTEQLRAFLLEVFPSAPAIGELVATVAPELEKESTTAVSWISGLATLFSASTGTFAVMKGLAHLNGVKRQNWMKYRLISAGYTLGLLILVILTLGSKLAAQIIISLINSKLELEALRSISASAVSVLQYCHIITLIGTFLMALALYRFPFEKGSRIRDRIPGALFASVVWFVAGKVFSFYISRFWKKYVIYGSLTAVVLIFLWAYLMMVILFLGAAINKSLNDNGSVPFE